MLIGFQKLFSKKISHIVIVFVSSCLTSAGAFDFKNNDGLNKNTLSNNNLLVTKKLLNKETSKVVHNADLLDYVRHNLTLDPIVNQRINTELLKKSFYACPTIYALYSIGITKKQVTS